MTSKAVPVFAFPWLVFDKHLDVPVAGFILRAEAMIYAGPGYEVRATPGLAEA